MTSCRGLCGVCGLCTLQPLENLDDCPKALLLRVGPESLQVLNTQSVRSVGSRRCHRLPRAGARVAALRVSHTHPTSMGLLLHQVVLHTFPYHTIMCWGHNNRIFKWRVFDAASDKLTDVVVATAKVRHT